MFRHYRAIFRELVFITSPTCRSVVIYKLIAIVLLLVILQNKKNAIFYIFVTLLLLIHVSTPYVAVILSALSTSFGLHMCGEVRSYLCNCFWLYESESGMYRKKLSRMNRDG